MLAAGRFQFGDSEDKLTGASMSQSTGDWDQPLGEAAGEPKEERLSWLEFRTNCNGWCDVRVYVLMVWYDP